MYKIYVNQSFIEIGLPISSPKNANYFRFGTENIKNLKKTLDQLLTNGIIEPVYFESDDPQILFKSLKKYFKRIKAAGGVVLNSEKEILTMFRRGFWDLPKGKLDYGESFDSAAIREVLEETGIQTIMSIPSKYIDTYHLYVMSGIWILKQTRWFELQAVAGQLSPQIEEDIELVIWIQKQALFLKTPIYNNIVEVLNKL